MAENDLIHSPDGEKLTNVAALKIIGQAVTVGLTAVKIGGVNARTVLLWRNTSAGAMFWGGSDVTTANGMPFPNDTTQSFDCLSGLDLYLISDSADQNVRFVEAI